MRSLYNLIIAAFIPLFIIGCSEDDDSGYIIKDTDKLSLSYAAVAEQFTVRVNGNWQATADVDWITLDPSSGLGDGRKYQYVNVTPQHNTGEKRNATITITSTGKKPTTLSVSQDDGRFSFGEPTVSGTLKDGVEVSQIYLVVPYSKSGGTETVSISVATTGVPGIEVASLTDTQLTMGDHSLSLAITGTPGDVGEATFAISITMNGNALDPLECTTNVISENIILSQYFDLMAWGGDCVANKTGTKPANTATPDQPTDSFASCTAGSDGTGNYFTDGNYPNWVSATGNPRGLADWDGWTTYERPGFVKIGTAASSGYLCTPPLDLSALGGQADVFVTFDFSTYYEDINKTPAPTQDVGLLRGHVRGSAKGTFTKSATIGVTERKWVTHTVKIEGVKTGDRICWGDYAGCVNANGKGANTTNGSQRFCLDNIEVTTKAAHEVTTPLTEPQNVQMTAASGSSLTFSWDPVEYATGYKLKLSFVSNPDFYTEIETTSQSYRFSNLVSATKYNLTVQALYNLNPDMNSPWTTELETQTAGATPKIATPSLQIISKTHGKFVVGWDLVTGWDDVKDRRFSIELATSPTGAAIRSYSALDLATSTKYRYSRFVFAGLDPSTTYYCRVQLLPRTNNTAYDPSEVATIAVTTDAAPTLSANVLLYKDFEDFWFGGDGTWGAWGVLLSSADAKAFESAKEFTYKPPVTTNTIGNVGDSFNTGSTSDEYRATRWAGGWTGQRVYEVPGYVKFGTGSSNGTLNTPALTALTGTSNVTLTMKACPYTEPNGTTGDMTVSPAAENSLTFTVTVNGAGTIDGASGDQKTITLTNNSNKNSDATTDRLQWTNHSVDITGADATTSITIKTLSSAGNFRMWLDDVMVVKKN